MDEIVGNVQDALTRVTRMGAEYADARIQAYEYELIVYDKNRVSDYSYSTTRGVGFRVFYAGRQGYASTTATDKQSLVEAALQALKNAKAIAAASKPSGPTADSAIGKDTAESSYKVDPFTVPEEDKIGLLRKAVETALAVDGVVSAIARFGAQKDRRIIVSSDGGLVRVSSVTTGLSLAAVARSEKGLEIVGDSWSRVSGWEYVSSLDVDSLSAETARLSVEASRASVPRSGRYTVVLEPEVVGLLMHEALGHASEGDLVVAGASILRGRLGERLAGEHVTVVDDGLHPDGYYVPYDDEGVRKGKTVVIEKGVLRRYLAGRAEAAVLGQDPTGNSRVMNYKSPILVRQTNYYIEPGDWKPEEIMEEAGNAIYVTAKGSKGGEVDPAAGTFTFSVGISWELEKGERKRPLRGVTLSGMILDVLKSIRAVGSDLKVKTSVFGGCGKNGQLVRVGDGGPHLLVENLVIGGR
ncbi:MAG: TldD/PmbA family protein [Desulfurococcales archaeon]|nr:TldD/PmbA family protein [Desulfurococcales archaeon]